MRGDDERWRHRSYDHARQHDRLHGRANRLSGGQYEMGEKHGTGLALSGGGFRATLFHLGAIWRLNEMAMLPEIGRFSSVSGGSILAGVLAVRRTGLKFQDGVAVNFGEEIVDPIWRFCSRNIDHAAFVFGIVAGTWKLEQSYRRHLVGESALRDLPDEPEFIFNAAHIETGRNCTLSKTGLHTWRLGDIELPDLELAKAMAASSACPPAFPAVTLRLDASAFIETEYADLFERDDLKSRVSLTDGGAYDNLGLHAVQSCPTILVSDGSSPLRPTRGKRFARQFNHRIMRPMETSLEQTRALRRREIVGQFLSNRKEGALWYTNTDIRDYPIKSPFPVRPEWNGYFASIRTRLNAFTDAEKSRLINWGYVLCDLSIRSYYRREKALPVRLPFEEFPFGDLPSEVV